MAELSQRTVRIAEKTLAKKLLPYPSAKPVLSHVLQLKVELNLSPKSPRMIIHHRLTNFRLCIHHKRPLPHNRLI